jgi:hypothetical protein
VRGDALGFTHFFSRINEGVKEGVNRNETGRWIERENHNLWSTAVSYKSDRISFVRYESTNKKAKEKPKLNPNRPALKSDGPELQIAEEPAFLPPFKGRLLYNIGGNLRDLGLKDEQQWQFVDAGHAHASIG